MLLSTDDEYSEIATEAYKCKKAYTSVVMVNLYKDLQRWELDNAFEMIFKLVPS